MDNLPFELRVLAGKVPGVSVWHQFGINKAVGSTLEYVSDLGGDQEVPATATVIKISSDNPNDALLGSGASTVIIQGLDADYNTISEVVEMKGQGEAITLQLFLRIQFVAAYTAGSNGVNEGTIYAGQGTITAGVPATKYAAILPEIGKTQMAMITVPRGQHALFDGFVTMSDSAKIAEVQFEMRAPGYSWISAIPLVLRGGSLQWREPILLLDQKTDIRVRAKVDVTTTDVSANIKLFFIPGKPMEGYFIAT